MIECILDPGRLAVRMRGHANTAPRGQDIVCAAASILIQTYAVTLAKFDELHTRYQFADGDGSVRFSGTPGPATINYATTCYRMLRDGLEMIRDGYPDKIQITIQSLDREGDP